MHINFFLINYELAVSLQMVYLITVTDIHYCLLAGLIKVVLYCVFLMIMIRVHTFPLFAIRPMYLTIRYACAHCVLSGYLYCVTCIILHFKIIDVQDVQESLE